MVLELHQVHPWLRLDRQRRERLRDEFASYRHLVDLGGSLEFDHGRPPSASVFLYRSDSTRTGT
jgi:hypothetical protein